MPVPNALTDGSYDRPGDPNYGEGADISAPEIIAMQRHPEVLQDPSVLAAKTPEDRAMAVITVLKKTDPTFDPQGVYRINQDGTVSPNNSSWFSDHLPLITTLMGAAIGGAGLIEGLGGGGAGAAAASSGGSAGAGAGAAGGLLPSTTIGTGMIPGIGGAGAGIGAGAGAAGVGADLLPSTPIGTGEIGPLGGASTFADTSGTGPLSTIGKYAKILSGVGSGISNATDAAAKQRIAQNDPYVQRGKLEMAQRNQDLKDVYLADAAQHPVHSPFDPVAPTLPSGDYAATLKNLSSQGATALSKGPQYGVGSFPSLQPGVLGKIGQWAGPILKTIGSLPGLFGG
jgi:hypothetical protein